MSIYDAFITVYIDQDYDEDLSKHQAFLQELHLMDYEVTLNEAKAIAYDIIWNGSAIAEDDLEGV